MKYITAVFKPSRLDAVLDAVTAAGASGEAVAKALARPLETDARDLAKKLQGLQTATLDYLSNFSVPFTPVFTDDMDISCRFNDGKVMRVSRLSPGQKVALALSFRLAQHKAIAKNVDFLCLDEPSDGLDKNNRQRLNLMLPTLRAISQQNNVQFILITHDEIPEGIVDNVIKLRD